MRDAKGRFVHGHKLLTDRDIATGRFVKRSVEKPTKLSEKPSVEEQVDQFLKELENEKGN